MGDDPAKSVAIYRQLLDPLVAEPAQTADPRGLGYNDALLGTMAALYTPIAWSDLTKGLIELAAGRGDTLLVLADEYWERDDQGHYSSGQDVYTAVNCVGGPQITDRAVMIEQDRRLREVSPYSSYGPFTGYAPLNRCSFWPVPPTSSPREAVAPGLPPILVVSSTGDPATPYQDGVNVARQLGGTLLTFEATQHTVVFNDVECVDTYAADYLINLTLPPPGATC